MAKTAKAPAEYIVPLNINGLEGRMLRLPDSYKTGNEILFVYGQHSTLERWWGVVQALNHQGAVTMPDIPGFGGMDSFYKIGLDASIDNMADYLATFIKLKYKRKKVTIIGMSLGMVIATRMLQRYPELTKKVEYFISMVGFSHRDDFIFSKKRQFFYRTGSYMFSKRIPAWIFQNIFLRPFLIRKFYARSYNAREKFAHISGDEFERTMDMEIELWKVNDIRTQMKTGFEMLTLDNTKIRIDLPVHHVASRKDRYFNNTKVEESLRRVFNDFVLYHTTDPNHAPTVITDVKTANLFYPVKIRNLLLKKK